ncbi:hypothetical protein GEMRC1_003350 [Eukaryota sp. GEM-RC1]
MSHRKKKSRPSISPVTNPEPSSAPPTSNLPFDPTRADALCSPLPTDLSINKPDPILPAHPNVSIPSPSSTPSLASSQDSTVTKEPKKTTKREGLEETTTRILRFAQTRGTVFFKDLNRDLDIDYRRAYDILNILQTTPLISKLDKKVDGQHPFIWCDGKALAEPIDVDTISSDLYESGVQLHESILRCHKIESLLRQGGDVPLNRYLLGFWRSLLLYLQK